MGQGQRRSNLPAETLRAFRGSTHTLGALAAVACSVSEVATAAKRPYRQSMLAESDRSCPTKTRSSDRGNR
jgi:hypothetical protein